MDMHHAREVIQQSRMNIAFDSMPTQNRYTVTVTNWGPKSPGNAGCQTCRINGINYTFCYGDPKKNLFA